jgi:hypothetical protein
MNHRTLYMTGGIALINMVGGFPGGFADRYLIGFAHEKTGSNGRALAIIAATLAIAALVIAAPAFALIRG